MRPIARDQMIRELKPIVERANVLTTLQAIRKNLRDLEEKKSYQHEAARQRLRNRIEEIKREYIFKVVDNATESSND